MRLNTYTLLGFTLLLTSHAEARVPGCEAAGLSSGTYTLPHGGLTRTFRLYVPPGYTSTVPSRLVMLFHGWGGNEDEFLGDRSVIDEARTRGYILAAPRGLGSGAPDHSRNSWTFRGSATGLAGTGVNSKSTAAAAAICETASTPDYRYPSCKTGTANNTCSWTQCQDDDIGFTVALFVTTVAFAPGPSQDAAKLGALASFAAAPLAWAVAKALRVRRQAPGR